MPSRITRYAAIPEVRDDLPSIANAVRALKQTVDVLTRQTGGTADWLATVDELGSSITTALEGSKNDWLNQFLNPKIDELFDKAERDADRLAEELRQEALVALGEVRSAIEDVRNGVEDANAITRFKFETLDAGLNEANAKISTESIARVTSTQALAGRIDTVNSQFQGNIAAVTTDIAAITSPTGAIATQINAVTTTNVGSRRTFVQSTTPVSLTTNAYWVDLNTLPVIVKQYNGSTWTTISSATIGPTAPTSPATNALWYDTTTTLLKRWSGSAWVTQTAFIQTKTPFVIMPDDLWLDVSTGNTLKKWNGSSWVAVTNVDTLGVLLSTVVSESISKTDLERTTAQRFNKLVSLSGDGKSATFEGTQLTTVDGTSAVASDLNALEVQTTGGSAGGFYRLFASSSPTDGALAEFNVQVRASETGTYANSGMRIQVLSGGTSRIKFNTDQFIIANASSTYTPFVVLSGQLQVDAALASAKMLGGFSTNAIYNATFEASIEGWATSTNTTGRTITVGRDFTTGTTLTGGHTLYATAVGTASAGTYYDIANYNKTAGQRYPVIAGNKYEASAYLGLASASSTQIVIGWRNSAGTLLSESAGNTITTSNAGGTALTGYGRSVVIATAPTGATTCEVFVRTNCSGASNPYTYVTRPYFGEAGPGQTEASNWTPGYEPQFGDFFQINTSNISTFIAGAAIGTAYIEDLAVNNAKIANAAITDAKIGTAEIKTLKIAGNAVTVSQVFSTVGDVNYIGSTYVTVISGSITVSGTQPIYVQFNGFVGGAAISGTPNTTESNVRAYAKIGTYEKMIVPDLTVGINQTHNSAGAALFTDIPAGTYTASVTYACTSGNQVLVRNPSLIVVETKR